MNSPEKGVPFHLCALPSSPSERSIFLRKLSRIELLDRARAFAAEERQIGLELLWHLREIDHRRIAEEMGFSGIFDYCVKVLRLSEGSAYRRVQAMRALQTSPNLAEALRDGRLNVTTTSQIQTFLLRAKRVGISTEEIRSRLGPLALTVPSISPENALFKACENLSRREVEKRLAELIPELPREERIRPVGNSEVEIRVTLSTHTRTKWTRIQQLAAHRLRFDTSARRLIELTTDVTLETLEKEKGLGVEEKGLGVPKKPAPNRQPTIPAAPTVLAPPTIPSATRTIPLAVRRSVWRRDQGRCRYFEPETAKRCESCFGLEVDHVKPWSLGGSSVDPENLRLLCVAHHRMMTERTFGPRPPATPAPESLIAFRKDGPELPP